VQKFTRPLTREIEVAGERLALTLSDQGINVRPVGSRKPPWEFAWTTVLYQLLGPGTTASVQPTTEQMGAVVELLKKGKPAELGSASEATSPPPAAPPAAPPVPPPVQEPSAAGIAVSSEVPSAQEVAPPP
jgi:hypothetical protein